MREGKDRWIGLVYWDVFFTVKHNVPEHDFLNSWQMLQIHFCCFYLSLILCPFGPTRQKKNIKKNWETLLNYPFPVLVPVNVEIFNFHNHAVWWMRYLNHYRCCFNGVDMFCLSGMWTGMCSCRWSPFTTVMLSSMRGSFWLWRHIKGDAATSPVALQQERGNQVILKPRVKAPRFQKCFSVNEFVSL